MSRTLEIFTEFSPLKRCSHHTSEMAMYIEIFAKSKGAHVKRDTLGNLLCSKGTPKIAFQSHYDMVCVGDAPPKMIAISEGWMSSPNSSLGADNGIGVAMMLSLLESYTDIECLFTADEEVGLLGANGIELTLKSRVMINLDSEKLGEIITSSAGGVEIEATWPLFFSEEKKRTITISDLPGGHSGVDIDKNIPSAIIEALKLVEDNESLIYAKGGERTNALARFAQIDVVTMPNPLTSFLKNAPHGVLERDENGEVLASVNFAFLNSDEKSLKATFYLRANDNERLNFWLSSLQNKYIQSGATLTISGYYGCWREDRHHPFCVNVTEAYQKFVPNVNMTSIHAGLECGILKEKLGLESVISMGPTIVQPHSVKEKLDIESVTVIEKVIDTIIKESK